MNMFVTFKHPDECMSSLFPIIPLPRFICNLAIHYFFPPPALELVTPPLDGLILPGITRDSVISLLKDHLSGHITLAGLAGQKVSLSERQVTMREVIEAQKEGTLVEMFGTGAFLLSSPVSSFLSSTFFLPPLFKFAKQSTLIRIICPFFP